MRKEKKWLFTFSALFIAIISFAIFWWIFFGELKKSRWYFYKGVFLSQINRIEDGISHFNKALSFKMPMLHAYRYMGELLKMTGRKDEAVIAFENARRYYPASFEVFIALVSLYSIKNSEWMIK